MLKLNDSVTRIKGIGEKKRRLLEAMGISTVYDLLGYYPYKYKDRRTVIPAADAVDDSDALVCGRLCRLHNRQLGNGRSMLECTFEDSSLRFHAVFFNMPYLSRSLAAGKEYVLFGKMRYRNGMKVWTNPEICLSGSERDIRGIIPVYRCPRGLTSSNLSGWIKYALEHTDMSSEWIDSIVIAERRLCGIDFAFRNIHFPQDNVRYRQAKFRIIYEQLLKYQLAIRLRRRDIEMGETDSSVPPVSVSPFIEALPFELTRGQLDSIRDIEADLESTRAMNRLIQGDVGCGKTIVAETAVYKCAVSGLQSAMMVPTEILARQHYERLNTDLSAFGIRTALLVSGMKASERRATLDAIRDGSVNVVVGTHAVIQSDVVFKELALVITDEQHRFGVNQRRLLTEKGRGVNTCVMSATPIPRTLAATVFGDMDFSIIRSVPSSRKPIITRALGRSGRERAYAHAAAEVREGRLVYIVAPSIDSEDTSMQSVNRLYSEVSSKFRGFRVGLLHGRMSGQEKEAVMNDFSAGLYRVLVATVVIEVGIDVPDATVIIIENADRFGLAQLHQLRGRVGRSSLQSYCYLISYSSSEAAEARIKAMVETTDGFELSEMDYALRGPGDLMGTMQSGTADRGILSLCAYTDILEMAVADSSYIIEAPERTDMEYVREFMDSHETADNSNII